MLVQFVEHRDALDCLRLTVLLANFNEFLFRRKKCNYTKVNELVIGYVYLRKKAMENGQLHAGFFFVFFFKS